MGVIFEIPATTPAGLDPEDIHKIEAIAAMADRRIAAANGPMG